MSQPPPPPTPPSPSHPSSSPTSPPPKQTDERPRGYREGGGGAFTSGSREVWLDLAHRRAPHVWCPWPPALAADGVCGGPLAWGTLWAAAALRARSSGVRGISVVTAGALGQRDFFPFFFGCAMARDWNSAGGRVFALASQLPAHMRSTPWPTPGI